MIRKNTVEHAASLRMQPAYALSALLAGALCLQATGGLFIKGLYRDNTWVASVFKGTDVETLFVDIPLLIGALAATIRGSVRARLVLVGMLSYAFYNNLYYLFSAFNRFFLVYVAVFVLSSAALISVLVATKPGNMSGPERDPLRKPVCVTMLACAAILALMWIGQAIMFVFNGNVPQLIIDSGGSTHMVAALDLTLIVPPLVLGAVWLWQGRPWGRVIATAILVQCTAITLDLIVTPPFQAAAGVKDAWAMVPLWALMGAAFLACSVHMLRTTEAAHPTLASQAHG